MKTSLLSFSAFALIICLISSCSTSSDLTSSSIIKKRRYLKGYQVDIKGTQKADEKAKVATAKMENVQPNEIVREQSPVLAQASTSNEITEADVKSPSVFSAPEKSETLGNRTEKAINTIDSERKADKKTKSNLSNKKLRSKAVSAVPQAGEANMVLYIILAIILPPLAVGLLYGIGTEFLISLVLTLLFFLPGVIYALIMVLKKG